MFFFQYYSRTQIWALTTLLLILFALLPFRWYWFHPEMKNLPAFLANIEIPLEKQKPFLCIEINSADSAAWIRLPGIGPKLSQRIVKYRDRIGGFKSIVDLKKVYGLSPETRARIEPFLHLEKVVKPHIQRRYAKRSYTQKRAYASPAVNAPSQVLDLNQADSTQLDAIPGIGPKLARRILKYRDILGFYFHTDQLRAVYGLSEENFQRMQPYLSAEIPPSPTLLDLNAANQWQIKRLAFWEEVHADSLLAARRELGRFDRWEELPQLASLQVMAEKELKAYFRL